MAISGGTFFTAFLTKGKLNLFYNSLMMCARLTLRRRAAGAWRSVGPSHRRSPSPDSRFVSKYIEYDKYQSELHSSNSSLNPTPTGWLQISKQFKQLKLKI